MLILLKAIIIISMKNNKLLLFILLILLLSICSFVSYKYGVSISEKKLQEEKELLYSLNKDELENLILVDGPIYVIGHKAPDSDTVCSAIAYADILNKMGYEAKAVVTDKVNNETAYILKSAGIETPEILYDASGLNIFLVDHSEYVQAVDNLIDGNVVGIIDHHGIGTVSVGHQVFYNAKPIGSTATIVWMTYMNYGIEIDKNIAHMLLGAVLSDSDNLTASTVIENDKKAVESLSKISGVIDLETYYNELHKEKLSYDGLTNKEILYLDYKEYESSGVKYGIGSVNAADGPTASSLAKRMKQALEEAVVNEDVDMMYASIRAEDTKTDYIVVANEYSKMIFESAFPNYDEFDGTAYIFKSSLGRKSKFVPGMNDYLAAKPHE